jgi:hypothetical protein
MEATTLKPGTRTMISQLPSVNECHGSFSNEDRLEVVGDRLVWHRIPDKAQTVVWSDHQMNSFMSGAREQEAVMASGREPSYFNGTD